MTQKYKLLPVQVENLRKQYDESFNKLKALNGVKGEEFSKRATGAEINMGLDASLLSSLSMLTKNYKEAKEMLGNYEILEYNNSDIIGLGSTFVIDLGTSKTLTLVEIHNAVDSSNLISISSPLGKAVMGCKVGDNVSYMVNKNLITGTVTDIIKENKKTL